MNAQELSRRIEAVESVKVDVAESKVKLDMIHDKLNDVALRLHKYVNKTLESEQEIRLEMKEIDSKIETAIKESKVKWGIFVFVAVAVFEFLKSVLLKVI